MQYACQVYFLLEHSLPRHSTCFLQREDPSNPNHYSLPYRRASRGDPVSLERRGVHPGRGDAVAAEAEVHDLVDDGQLGAYVAQQ